MKLHFEDPDFFTTGAIGPKGQRVFFLQAGQGDNIASVKLEKQQVATLADYLEHLLDMLPSESGELRPEDVEVLAEPEEPELLLWTVGGLEIGYHATEDRIALAIEELQVSDAEEGDAWGSEGAGEFDEFDDDDDFDDDETDGGSLDRISILLRRDQTMAFIMRARELVTAGRPLCKLCGDPLNSDDGFCPCFN